MAPPGPTRASSAARTPPLLGVPIAIKDVLSTRGVRTTAGSRILGQLRADLGTRPSSRGLRALGAVFLGKLNCDEFAHGVVPPRNSGLWPRRANPWDENARAWGGHPAARLWRWLPTYAAQRSAPTPAGASASRRPCAASPGLKKLVRASVALWPDRVRLVAGYRGRADQGCLRRPRSCSRAMEGRDPTGFPPSVDVSPIDPARARGRAGRVAGRRKGRRAEGVLHRPASSPT
jgi:hypothetical protein